MILVDTSVWIDHLRKGNALLSFLLEQGVVLMHPFVIGELACGSIVNRREILGLLETLPSIGPAGHAEVLQFIERKQLHGRGIGWIDAHLLSSALLSRAPLLTLDERLRRVAEYLEISYRSVR